MCVAGVDEESPGLRRRACRRDDALADRGEGVNDGVEGEAVVGDTTATDDDPDEGAATGCMKEASRGEGSVGVAVTDCSREEEEDDDDDDTGGDETIAFFEFRFAAAAASLALILIGALQVKHIFRRDMVPFMIFALRLWS